MIDSHAHLYSPQLVNKYDSVIRRFTDGGGCAVVNSSTDFESSLTVLGQASKYQAVYPALAIHPEVLIPGSEIYISEANQKWIGQNVERVVDLLEKNQEVVALGECGLDYYWIKKQRLPEASKLYDLQKDLLGRQIEISKTLDLPMIIHCRDQDDDKQAESEILELIVKKGGGCTKGVFHSYTGSQSYLEDILDLGFYVSFNGIITYRSGDNVRELLEMVPMERILLETDSPYLVPNKRRSSGVDVCEPLFVDEVAEKTARIKGVSVENVWSSVYENFETLFGVDVEV